MAHCSLPIDRVSRAIASCRWCDVNLRGGQTSRCTPWRGSCRREVRFFVAIGPKRTFATGALGNLLMGVSPRHTNVTCFGRPLTSVGGPPESTSAVSEANFLEFRRYPKSFRPPVCGGDFSISEFCCLRLGSKALRPVRGRANRRREISNSNDVRSWVECRHRA